MVAQLQPRVPQSGFPQGSPSAPAPFGKTGAEAAPAAQLSDYNLKNAPGDYNAWQAATLVYKQTVLIPLDDFYELRQPTTPFFQIASPQGQPTVLQYVGPMIRNYLDATCDYIRPDAMRISVDIADNAAATQEECGDTAGALEYIGRFHVNQRIGNIFEQVKFLTALRGTCFVQVMFLPPDEAAKTNRKFPLRWDVHDVMDCKWIKGEAGGIAQMIVLKKKKGREIPMAWRAAGNVVDMAAEYDVLEYWDETSAGALIGGTIVKPLALHGYRDMNGDPCCPFIPFMHKPRAQRIGQVAPLPSGVSQYSETMGTPLCEALLPVVGTDSKMMTYRLHNYQRNSRGLIVLEGIATNEEGDKMEIDLDQGVAVVNAGGDVKWIGPPNLDTLAQGLDQRIQSDIAGGSASSAAMGGQIQVNVSGTSANHQTSFSRSRAESLALTLEDGWAAVLTLTTSILRDFLQDGAADIHAKRSGGQMPTILPTKAARDFWTGDRQALPGYLGGGERPLVPSTLADIRTVRVDIEASTRTPSEVEAQQALAMEKSELVDLDWIRANKLHIDNIPEVKESIILQKMEADPTNPWGQYKQKEALVNLLIGGIADPGQKQGILQALDQQRQQALMAVLAAPPPPPQAAAPPGGAPPGQPPPQGPPQAPPQGIPAMPPGQPGAPPFQPPQLMQPVGVQPTAPPPNFAPPPDMNPMQQMGAA